MTIFEKIINREIPSNIVWEDDKHIAILDIHPVQPGHTLVIPKITTDYLFDMDVESYTALMLASYEVAKILKDKLNCTRVCMILEGYEIPHVHVKLIPTNSPTDLGPIHTPEMASDEELKRVLGSILR